MIPLFLSRIDQEKNDGGRQKAAYAVNVYRISLDSFVSVKKVKTPFAQSRYPWKNNYQNGKCVLSSQLLTIPNLTHRKQILSGCYFSTQIVKDLQLPDKVMNSATAIHKLKLFQQTPLILSAPRSSSGSRVFPAKPACSTIVDLTTRDSAFSEYPVKTSASTCLPRVHRFFSFSCAAVN